MADRRRWSDWDLVIGVAESKSIAEVCRRLGISPRGGNYRTIHRRIAQLRLNTSHFTGQGWRKGSTHPITPARPLSECLTADSTYQTSKLRIRLVREGFKEHRCEGCGLDQWLGQAIPLELEHTNGVSTDHRLENLKLLCPNCHALTPTYRARNVATRRRSL